MKPAEQSSLWSDTDGNAVRAAHVNAMSSAVEDHPALAGEAEGDRLLSQGRGVPAHTAPRSHRVQSGESASR